MKIYISGAMTGIEDLNYPAFFRAAALIRAAGHEPINPAEDAPAGLTWHQYMRRALCLLCGADGVWMLPGWQQSNGARLEYTVACALDMPVTHITRAELKGSEARS
ncbi:MAG: DUF4406 domain-containing protein [Bacilli bacterium]